MSRRVSCIPSADDAFCDTATAAMGAIDGEVGHDEIPSALADLLRGSYPLVEVHPQDPLARFFDDEVWYVYRDGKPSVASLGPQVGPLEPEGTA
jgi:hypothetical protein